MLSKTSLKTRQLVFKEQGSVLLWLLGLFLFAMTTIGVLVSVIGMTERTADLQLLTDKAVLAASNRLDFGNFYLSGIPSEIQIDQVLARKRAKEIFADADFLVSSFVFKLSQNEVNLTAFTKYELLNFAGYQVMIPLKAGSTATIWSP